MRQSKEVVDLRVVTLGDQAYVLLSDLQKYCEHVELNMRFSGIAEGQAGHMEAAAGYAVAAVCMETIRERLRDGKVVEEGGDEDGE